MSTPQFAGAQISMEAPPAPTPVPVEEGLVKLDQSNIRVHAIGKIVGEKSSGKIGVFQQIQGVAEVDEKSQELKSLRLELASSSFTCGDKELDAQVKGPTFLDTEKFAKIEFQSEEVFDDEVEGRKRINGVLTLHGSAIDISLVCMPRFDDDGLRMSARTQINRSDFGMSELQGIYEDRIEILVDIGLPSELPKRQRTFIRRDRR